MSPRIGIPLSVLIVGCSLGLLGLVILALSPQERRDRYRRGAQPNASRWLALTLALALVAGGLSVGIGGTASGSEPVHSLPYWIGTSLLFALVTIIGLTMVFRRASKALGRSVNQALHESGGNPAGLPRAVRRRMTVAGVGVIMLAAMLTVWLQGR